MSETPRVRRRDNGKWTVQVSRGSDPVTGRRVRPSKVIEADDEQEAQRIADEWYERIRTPTLDEGLTEYVRTKDVLNNIGVSSLRTYKTLIKNCISPYIGRTNISEVKAAHIQRLYRVLLAPVDEGGKGLSLATVSTVHSLLSGAFKWFVRMGMRESSPMSDVNRPKLDPVEPKAIVDEGDLAKLTGFIERWAVRPPDQKEMPEVVFMRHRMESIAYMIALYTGMRIGEICALRWCDVDPETRMIRVAATIVTPDCGGIMRQEHTKSKKVRMVAVGSDLVDALALWRAEQDARARTEPTMPIVTTDGSFISPAYLRGLWASMCKDEGIRGRYKFHALRHTHATYLLSSCRMSIKAVSERLGHARPSITADVYAHVMPNDDRRAADAFDNFISERGVHDSARMDPWQRLVKRRFEDSADAAGL